MNANDSAVLKKNGDMAVRVIGEETIILPVYRSSDDINCLYTLNPSAARVWELIDGKRTVGDIKKLILEEFDVTPSGLDREMHGLIADFHEMKAITPAPGKRKKP